MLVPQPYAHTIVVAEGEGGWNVKKRATVNEPELQRRRREEMGACPWDVRVRTLAFSLAPLHPPHDSFPLTQSSCTRLLYAVLSGTPCVRLVLRTCVRSRSCLPLLVPAPQANESMPGVWKETRQALLR